MTPAESEMDCIWCGARFPVVESWSHISNHYIAQGSLAFIIRADGVCDRCGERPEDQQAHVVEHVNQERE